VRKLRRYWGSAEIAEACGVSVQAVSNWLARGQMPEPYIRLRMGPVWDASRPAFAKWLKEKRKHQAGRVRKARRAA